MWTTLVPIRPVPPKTTIFMVSPSLFAAAKLQFCVGSDCAVARCQSSVRWPGTSKLLIKLLVDDSSAAALRHKGDRPLHQDKQAIGESDQKVNVHGHPEKPCWESGETRKAQIGNSIGATNDGEIALVPVPEGCRGGAICRSGADQSRGVLSFLNGWLRGAGKNHGLARSYTDEIAGRCNYGRGVADGEDLRITGHGEIGVDVDSSRGIGGDAEPLGRGGRDYAGSPDDIW